MREIVLDTETTGLSPRDGHRVVEIGCLELVHHMPTDQTFHKYLNPERAMPSQAFEIHGLSDEFLFDKPLFSDIADEFINFIGDAVLIIHNAPFDLGFLNHELSRVDRPPIDEAQVIDTLSLAQRKHPAASNSLDALCKRYNVDNSHREKHGALLDSELLAEVYIELIGGRQPTLTLVDDSDTGTAAKTTRNRLAAKARPAALPARLSDAERTAHEAFIETLGPAALWHSASGSRD